MWFVIRLGLIAILPTIWPLRSADAVDQTVLGKQFLLMNPGAPERRKVIISAREAAYGISLEGDPTLNGAVLSFQVYGRLRSSQDFALPAGVSTATGRPFWSGDPDRGYSYRDARGENGAVTRARVRRTHSGLFEITVRIDAQHSDIDLVPPNPGTDSCVRFAIAGGDDYSVLFADGKVENDGSGLFKMTQPVGEATCLPTSTPTSSSTTTTDPAFVSRLRDQNGDGLLRIACIGDSNTNAALQPDSWCGDLGNLLRPIDSNAQVIWEALFGATAKAFGLFWADNPTLPLDGAVYVNRTIGLVPQPDIAIVALGTNDVLHHIPDETPEEIVSALLEHLVALETAGIDGMVALVPPVGYPGRTPTIDRRVAAVNALLHATVPAKDLVAFDVFPDSDYDADVPPDPIRTAVRDGVHFNVAGMTHRATAALWALQNSTP